MLPWIDPVDVTVDLCGRCDNLWAITMDVWM